MSFVRIKRLTNLLLLKYALWVPVTLAAGTTVPGVNVGSVAFQNIGEVINTLVTAAIIVSGLAAFAFLILGGFQYLTSGGDKMQAQAARDRITYAILGLAIVAAAVAVVQVLGAVFGFNIIGGIKWPGPTATTVGQ